MGYSLSLTIKTHSVVAGHTTVADLGGITYNLAPMIKKAIGISFSELDGKPATEVATQMGLLIERLTKDPNEYKVLQPVNGWGTYDSLLEKAYKIKNACLENDLCTFRAT